MNSIINIFSGILLLVCQCQIIALIFIMNLTTFFGWVILITKLNGTEIKLLSKLNYLAGGLASSDYAPTKQQGEVHLLLKRQLAEVRQRLNRVLNEDLTAFDKLLVDNNAGTVIKRTP